MKNVRRDVIVKLLNGLEESRKYAVEHNASYPKSYKYSTNNVNIMCITILMLTFITLTVYIMMALVEIRPYGMVRYPTT